jgi:hypothetical protein
VQALKYKVVLRSGLCKVLSTKQYAEKRQQRCTDVIISVLAWKQHSAVPMLALFPCGSVVCLKSCRCDDHSVRRANETVDPTILLTWITFFPLRAPNRSELAGYGALL